MQKIFSIKNKNERKIITILGIKIKLRKNVKNQIEYHSKLLRELQLSSLTLKNTLLEMQIDNYLSSEANFDNSVLIVTHELSFTGAPIVLLPVIKYFQKQGKKVDVISFKDGLLHNWFIKKGIKTFIFDDICYQQAQFLKLSLNYTTILCNTCVTFPAVDLLNRANKKSLWWLHESEVFKNFCTPEFTKNGINSLPETLSKSDNVYTVSEYSKKFLSKYNPNIKILRYGIEDFKDTEEENSQKKSFCIAIVGTILPRKGQDILLETFSLLPQKYKKNIKIKLIGDDSIDFAINLKNQYKNNPNIIFCGQKYFDNKKEIYKDVDLLCTVSRDDPLPVVVTEAMIMEIPTLVSQNVGQYELIEDKINGLKVETNNKVQLKEKIIWAFENRERLKEIGKKGRNIYLENFTTDKFEKSFETSLCSLADIN